MRVVIAGGTGFLGSPLAETYAEDGHDVPGLQLGQVDEVLDNPLHDYVARLAETQRG